jgi:hypothetical protein
MSFTDSGYGFQLPSDGISDLAGVAFMVRQLVAVLDTMKLAQVVAVRGGGVAPAGVVDVQLLVNQIDGATPPNATPRGIVTNIPWSRVAGGMNAVICDPQVNDIGYVVAADRDISVVKTTFAKANPGSQRRFSISDGVYTSMALNVTPNQYLVFTSTGVRLVDKNGNSVAMSDTGITLTDLSRNVIQTSSSGIVVQIGGTTIMQVMSSGIVVTGTITSSWNIQSTGGNLIGSSGVDLDNHTHPVTAIKSGTDTVETGPPTG